MRGGGEWTGSLLSYINIEARVGKNHPDSEDPWRRERGVDGAFGRVLGDVFPHGTASILPEKLLRAMLLQAFYSIRSERQLMERLEFDLLVRRHRRRRRGRGSFDGSKNRDRLLEGEIAAKFMALCSISLG